MIRTLRRWFKWNRSPNLTVNIATFFEARNAFRHGELRAVSLEIAELRARAADCERYARKLARELGYRDVDSALRASRTAMNGNADVG